MTNHKKTPLPIGDLWKHIDERYNYAAFDSCVKFYEKKNPSTKKWEGYGESNQA